jgi:hypothetical protein
MSAYAEQLSALQNAMIAGERVPMLPLIKLSRHNEFPPEARLSVYTEGYEIRLFESVREDFPALEYYLGEEKFAEKVTDYIRQNPSTFWDLALYSLSFAEAFDDPKAHTLATLEAAIIEVFWMPESAPWQPDTTTSSESLMEQNIPLRAASKLLTLSHPVEEYLAAFRREEPIEMPAASTQYMLLVRHENEVKRHIIPAEEYAALTHLQQGASLATALENAPSIEAVQGWFSQWIAEGFLAAISHQR